MHKLFLVLVLLGSALAYGAPSTPATPPNPLYSQLKTYRNYFIVRGVKPVADYFDAWFMVGDYVHCSIPVTSLNELAAATKQSWDCSDGAFGIPPEKPIPPVPADKAELGDAVNKAVMRLYPNAHDLKLTYSGRFGTVAVDEIIPINVNADATKRSAVFASMNYQVNEEATTLVPYGFQSYTNEEGLCSPVFPQQCDAEPLLIDVDLPAGVEGTTVLGNHMGGDSGDSKNPLYMKAFDAFKTALLKAMPALRQGTYVNPANAILGRQGTEILPKGLDVKLTYEINVYPRGKSTWGAVAQPGSGGNLDFTFSVTDAYRAPLVVHATQVSAKIEGALTVDLRAKSMTLKLSDSSGKTYTIQSQIQGDFLVDGDSTSGLRVAPASYIYAKFSGGDQPQGSLGSYSFRGFGDYTQIDCYPQGFDVDYKR